MPRKKQAETLPGTAAAPARIHCPACKSEISSDGAALHSRSKYLEDLLERDADVAKLEKVVEGLEAKLTAAKKELEAEREKKVVAAQTKPEANKDATVGKQEQGKRSSGGESWW